MHKLIIAILLMFLATLPACGQTAGFVGVQTTRQQVFDAVSSTQTSSVLRNIGQSSHWLEYCLTGTTTLVKISLEASFNGSTNWFAIGTGTDTGIGCHVIEAGGYYPNVRVNFEKYNSAGTLSAFYSASAAPVSAAGSGTVRNRQVTAMNSIEGYSTQSQSAAANWASRTNPGGSVGVLSLGLPAGQESTFGVISTHLHRVVVSCTAACSIDILKSATAGVGCAAANGGGLYITGTGGVAGKSVANDVASCGTPPGGGIVIFPATPILANTPTAIDLTGMVLRAGHDGELVFRSAAALTGVMTFTVFYYERYER